VPPIRLREKRKQRKALYQFRKQLIKGINSEIGDRPPNGKKRQNGLGPPLGRSRGRRRNSFGKKGEKK